MNIYDSFIDPYYSHRFIGTQKLSEMLQQPYDLFKPGWADHYILGMVNQVKHCHRGQQETQIKYYVDSVIRNFAKSANVSESAL